MIVSLSLVLLAVWGRSVTTLGDGDGWVRAFKKWRISCLMRALVKGRNSVWTMIILDKGGTRLAGVAPLLRHVRPL